MTSEGWLSRWKKRHGVHYLTVCGEQLSADQNAANEFAQTLLDTIRKEKFTPERIYNLDETGLNFKLLTEKALATLQESTATGLKTKKERITVAVCTNAARSHKLPLFVIGKSVKPRDFKNININTLPVYYRAKKSAWMRSFLFEEWFSNEFVPKAKAYLTYLKLRIKVTSQLQLLLLDNAPTHPTNLSSKAKERRNRVPMMEQMTILLR